MQHSIDITATGDIESPLHGSNVIAVPNPATGAARDALHVAQMCISEV